MGQHGLLQRGAWVVRTILLCSTTAKGPSGNHASVFRRGGGSSFRIQHASYVKLLSEILDPWFFSSRNDSRVQVPSGVDPSRRRM